MNPNRLPGLSRSRQAIFCLIYFLLFTLVALPPCLAIQEDDAKPKDGIREQTIYIPYEKLRSVFEEKGRGVFIPYEDFQRIWEAARKNTQKVKPITAPLGALISSIDSVATLGNEVVSVEANITIELLKKGWHKIPLRLDDAAIRSAKISGEDAKIVTSGKSYLLLIHHKKDQSETIELKLQYAKSLSKNGAQSLVSFNAPQAPVNRWTIRTGESDIDVQVEPMIASSEQPRDADQDKEILAFVGTAPQVKLTWTPKAEGAAGLEALISSSIQSKVRIRSGVVRTTANVQLDISRAEIRKTTLELPADQKVVSVFDRNVKRWNVSKENELQQVQIELFEAALGKQSIVIELEKFVDETDQTDVAAPQIKVMESSRNSGSILVNVGDGLRVEPKKKDGLLQLDQTEVAAQSREPWKLGFRYSTLPHDLMLSVETIQPQIECTQLVEYVIRPRKLEAFVSALFDVKDAGVFQVKLNVPKDFEIRDVRTVKNGQATIDVPVDSFYRDAKNPEIVTVTLARKALGKFAVVVNLDQPNDQLTLDSPTENDTSLSFRLPKVDLANVNYSLGNFVVYAPESLRVNAESTDSLRKTGFDQIYKLFSKSPGNDVRPVLAYNFAHSDANIDLKARRRKPQVNVEQMVTVAVQTGAAKFESSLYYDVRYSSVKSLRVDVPKALVDQLRVLTSGIIQQPISPTPDDVSDGYVALQLTGEDEFFGSKRIRFSWESEIKNLTLGESVDVSVPPLKPANVDRSTGKIVLAKSETIDVRPTDEATGLRPIDPQTDLGARAPSMDASMAFEFSGDWNLDLTASRFELQNLKQTSISRALVQAVVLRQDELSVRCIYKIRSVRQRIAIRLPAGFDPETSFDDQPVLINNSPVTPERGGDDLIFVPLVGQQSDKPFLLELRYNIAGNGRQIELPEFTEDPAAQKCYLAVYVPYEKALINTRGAWTDETIGDNHQSLLAAIGVDSSNWRNMFQAREVNAQKYVSWVAEGTSCAGNPGRSFEVDGRAYVFSAIRPGPGELGRMSLTVLSLWFINLIVFGSILGIGLTLTRARIHVQVAFAMFVLAALLFVGILAPLVAEHLFGPALVATALLVGVAWIAGHFIRWQSTIFNYLSASTERMDSLNEAFEANLASEEETEGPPDADDTATPASTNDGDGGEA